MTAINMTSRRNEATQRKRSAIGLEQLLLACGILSALLYLAMNVVLARQSPGYDWTSQTISELSAIDAPSRSPWLLPGLTYTVLATAFGWGVLKAGRGDRKVRFAGLALLCFGALGLLWPFAPMHQREALAAGGGSLTDTAHIALGMISVVAMTLAVAFGAAALGNKFRYYSAATVLAVFAFGALTGMGAPSVSANLPTPWLGLWERISIGAFMLWEVVFAIILL